jgi:hypothetical protein
VINEDGKIFCKKRIMNDQVLSFLKPFNVEKVGFEASTSIAPLYRALSKEGYRVQVSHPKKTRYIAECDRLILREVMRKKWGKLSLF